MGAPSFLEPGSTIPAGSEQPEDLGLGRPPGDAHYRAYVGPPEDYDLVAAMSFGLLTLLGLRQQHRLLDIGCGSLRTGRLLIPYLNRAGYTGLEPNSWLVEDAIRHELGQDMIRIKRPEFVFSADIEALTATGCRYHYLLAQSIFSHCGLDLFEQWLSRSAGLLTESGALVATYVPAHEDSSARGWIYPECVGYTLQTVGRLASQNGLQLVPLDWHHPRQRWLLFAKPGFGAEWYRDRPLSWNECFDRFDGNRQVLGLEGSD